MFEILVSGLTTVPVFIYFEVLDSGSGTESLEVVVHRILVSSVTGFKP